MAGTTGRLSVADDGSALAWYQWRLRGLLPPRIQTELLRACLGEGSSAHAAWQSFIDGAGNPKRYFERAPGSLKGLLPFVEHSLARNAIDPGQEFATYARVAVVREELRDRIYREVFLQVIDSVSSVTRQRIVLRGLAIADTAYPAPNRRHNHGIDLLLDEEDLGAASNALSDLGCRPVPRQSNAHRRRYLHRSGLPVTLHTRLFEMPFLTEPVAAIRSRAQPLELNGTAVDVLSAADHLLHICGHASYSQSRNSLRWVCDAVLLLRSTDIKTWDVLVCTAAQTGLALPMVLVLRYLCDHFGSPVPSAPLMQLRLRHRLNEHSVRAATHAIVLECARPREDDGARQRPDLRALVHFLRFRAAPSAAYMRWKYSVDGPVATAVRYVRRPLQFLLRRSMRLLRREPAG